MAAVLLQLRVAEMEINKAHNIIEHRDEILSRPARVWFTDESKKKPASKMCTRVVVSHGQIAIFLLFVWPPNHTPSTNTPVF